MVSLVIIERVFSSYRKPVYDRINEQINLILLHGRNNSGIKTASTYYSKQIFSIQYGKRDTNILLFPLMEIFKIKPKVIVCDLAMGMLNLPVIIFLSKFLKIKFVFWSHGYNRKTGFDPNKRLIDKYRLFLLRTVDANILYSESDKIFMGEYLSNPIYVAQNTLETDVLSKIYEDLKIEGKSSVKKRLGITHDFNIVFIGRLLSSKMPELLINIYDEFFFIYGLRIGVHFIGEGEMLEQLRKTVSEKRHPEDFYFHGSIYDDNINGEILYASDLMVIPGALGLSVNHAFCFNCPVISFANKGGKPGHGPEVEYVVNGITGFLVNDFNSMVEAIYNYIENEGLRNEMQKNIRFFVREKFPIEKMVQGVLDCVNPLML